MGTCRSTNVSEERKEARGREKAFPPFGAFSHMWVIDSPSSAWQIKTYFICHKNLQRAIKTQDFFCHFLSPPQITELYRLGQFETKKNATDKKNYKKLLGISDPPTIFLWTSATDNSSFFSKVCGRGQVRVTLSYKVFLILWFQSGSFL